MDRLTEIRELFEFNRWANGQILDAAAALPAADLTRDLGSSFPSVRDTLVHLVGADWMWLSRIHGVSPRAMPEGWKESGIEQLRERWGEVQERWRVFLDGLQESRLDEVVHYSNVAGDAFDSALWQILRHVVNHSTYHRGQVTTMLRQLGAKPPSTDLIRYYRTVRVRA